eukprot:TRINITY_DN165_c1_g1_i2.p1 TRINITY_DN165_c1_g1~~TRINITY_DN165_c1_g1_i2.p1  ORF type:complete len:333 (+),score=73.95 TRINITY_DN165_c1_g1_i2:95-1000(+)
MSLSLEDRFHKAVDFLQNTPESSAYSPDVDQKLRFYSLFKQSTVGPCKAKKPSFYDMVGKAKWDAWDKLRNMSKETAMTQYIDEIILICKKINTKDGNEMLNILVQQPPPPPPQQQQQVRSKKHTSPSPTEKQTSRTISSPPTTAAPVDLYVDLASQPSRAVLWFCIATAIPHNVNIIKLGAREQRKDSYKEINPFQKVPAMVTGSGFKVFERCASHACGLLPNPTASSSPLQHYHLISSVTPFSNIWRTNTVFLNIGTPVTCVSEHSLIVTWIGITSTLGKVPPDSCGISVLRGCWVCRC